MDKGSVRKAALQRREQISDKLAKSQVIQNRVWDMVKDDRCIGIYMAMADEVQTSTLLARCWAHGIQTAIPKVEDGVIRFYLITSMEDVQEGHFHVMEPVTGKVAEAIASLVIPMVAFDEQGNRLGYGKGYYDRYLKQFGGKRIGVAFAEQKAASLPTEVHDEIIDLIVTEDQMYRKA